MASFRDAIRAGIGTTIIPPFGGAAPSPESDLDAHMRREEARRLHQAELRRMEQESEDAADERELNRLEREVRRAELLATKQALMPKPDGGAAYAQALVSAQQHMTEMLLSNQQRSDERFERLMERMAALSTPQDGASAVTGQVMMVKELLGAVGTLVPQQPPTQQLSASDLIALERARWEREDGISARVIEDRRRQDERDLRRAAIENESERNGILAEGFAEFGKVFGPAFQGMLMERMGGGQPAEENGQRTVQVACPGCGLEQRQPIPQGEPVLRCAGCQAEFDLILDPTAAGSAGGNGHLEAPREQTA